MRLWFVKEMRSPLFLVDAGRKDESRDSGSD